MILFGIDPGYHRVGWGVIDSNARAQTVVAYGCIETDRALDLPERLQTIYKEITRLLVLYKPKVVALEKLYFAQSVTTALKVSEARGVLLLATAELKIPVLELTNSQVKQGFTGFGGAKKFQMQEMVRLIFKMDKAPQPDDAADALAMAYVAAMRIRR